MDTETLDKLYLEWSQFTEAKTARESWFEDALREIASGALSRDDCIKQAKIALTKWRQKLGR